MSPLKEERGEMTLMFYCFQFVWLIDNYNWFCFDYYQECTGSVGLSNATGCDCNPWGERSYRACTCIAPFDWLKCTCWEHLNLWFILFDICIEDEFKRGLRFSVFSWIRLRNAKLSGSEAYSWLNLKCFFFFFWQLEAMGFDRALVLEVFFACNKNEELAANYLLDHMHEFEDWLKSPFSCSPPFFFFFLFHVGCIYSCG